MECPLVTLDALPYIDEQYNDMDMKKHVDDLIQEVLTIECKCGWTLTLDIGNEKRSRSSID